MFKKTISLIGFALFVNFAQAQLPTEKDIELSRTAIALVKAGKTKESLKVIQKIPNPVVKNSTSLDYVDGLFSLGEKAQGFEFADNFLKSFKNAGNDSGKTSAYSTYSLHYSHILVNHQEYEKAYQIMTPILKDEQRIRYNNQETYIKALVGLSKNTEAYQQICQAITQGRATAFVADTLLGRVCEKLGYDQRSSIKKKDSLMDIFTLYIKDELKKKAVKRAAPEFHLKDAEGSTVSLKDYSGKTVILDFWANWCSPCKETFPMMKKAQQHYKNNPDVVFLFIDTFERNTADPVAASVKYMKDNHFDFKVLFDVKMAQNEYEVAKSYSVKGLPTKFIINGDGNIVLASEGGINYYHSDLYSFSHLTAMIDLARSGEI